MTEKNAVTSPRAKFSLEVPDALRRELYRIFKREGWNSFGPVVMDATVENLEKWIQFVTSLNDAMPIFDDAYRMEQPMYDLSLAQKAVHRAVEQALNSMKEFELSIQAWGENKIRAEARLALLAPALEMGRADLAKVEGAAKEAREVLDAVTAAVALYDSYRLSPAQ
jgi:hypothetical protein